MARTRQSSSPHSARSVVARALGVAAGRFPRLPLDEFDPGGLTGVERALAVAVHRTVVQRWITLEFLLDRHLRKPMRNLEPAMRGVLLSAAAQIVCFDRMPVHAIVDESVELARVLVRPGAAKLANAVLRRLSEDIDRVGTTEPWTPGRDRLSRDEGTILLAGDLLPEPGDLAEHLSIATSHPAGLVKRWIDAFGEETTIEICRHGVATPPTIVAVEGDPPANVPCRRHEADGYVVWDGSYEQLTAFLSGGPARRVQDPASAEPVKTTAKLTPERIIDYCAGKGTKTLQLAATHPEAQIIAGDVDDCRREQLASAVDELANVTVATPVELGERQCWADLLVLDVPCTNTATLARRPEARYRFNQRQVSSLVGLQRQIIRRALPLLRPAGRVLYCTCSLEAAENAQQATWLRRQTGGELLFEQLIPPQGHGMTYHDGSYAALVRLPDGTGTRVR